MEDSVERAVEIVLKSKYLVAFTGAGVSAESGVPTFRGKNGLWEKFKPEELASLEAFVRDPERVWGWYKWRMEVIASVEPNLAHYALAKLEEKNILKHLITQNVDGLHQRAGSKRVVELHGNIWRVKCTMCSYKAKLEKPPEETPLKCPKCKNLLRPDVVWFGEPIPKREWRKAVEETLKADTLLVIGTSGIVMPAALIPRIAWENNAKIIEVNPEKTPITQIATIKISVTATQFSKKLLERLKQLNHHPL